MSAAKIRKCKEASCFFNGRADSSTMSFEAPLAVGGDYMEMMDSFGAPENVPGEATSSSLSGQGGNQEVDSKPNKPNKPRAKGKAHKNEPAEAN